MGFSMADDDANNLKTGQPMADNNNNNADITSPQKCNNKNKWETKLLSFNLVIY